MRFHVLIGLLVLVFFSVPVSTADKCRVLVVVGMEDERAIAAGDGVDVVVGTANATVLRERLKNVNAKNIGAVYSFGVAGGLDPALKAGDLLGEGKKPTFMAHYYFTLSTSSFIDYQQPIKFRKKSQRL